MVVVFGLFTHIATAATSNPLAINGLLAKIYYHIINPAITLGFIISMVYFMYGIVDFIRKRDTSASDAIEGKNHLLYGTIGLFIFVSAFAIARIMSRIIVPDTMVKDSKTGQTLRIETP